MEALGICLKGLVPTTYAKAVAEKGAFVADLKIVSWNTAAGVERHAGQNIGRTPEERAVIHQAASVSPP